MIHTVRIRRIDGATHDAEDAIAAIRRRLSPRGDMVSAKGRQLTEEVFGAALSPRQVVERICDDVAKRGLHAVLEYSYKLDKAELTASTLRVSPEEIRAAHDQAAPDYLATLRRIRATILTFQQAILQRDVVLAQSDHELRLVYRPLQRIGICIPGGAAAYPSTLLMTAVPAQAAGVKEIVVIAPPTRFGANNPDLLAACHELGITEVYRMGGAQGVAALAFGIEGVAPVDKIVGPGNLFVALAKQRVSECVGIDMLAGPTEVVILADDTANPSYIAADLLAQAEHAPGASILITWAPGLVDRVEQAVNEQVIGLERCGLTIESLESYGALISTPTEDDACRLADTIAPEHLQIVTAAPATTLANVHHAGAVFLGQHTPVAVGDYVAGPSHTLPTGGTARFASGLSSNDFLRRMSVIEFTPDRLRAVADDLRLLAAKEGLTAHSKSVDIRLNHPS